MFSLWMLGQFIACKGCQETKVQDIDTGENGKILKQLG